jgi:HAD superfamily hydrolase (TIGR01459 family)
MTTLRFAEHLRDLVAGVDVLLSDIWGVVHNGLVAFPEACEALHTFRSRGGTVILITNAPRPADSVQRQLRKLGVADDTYDAIVSSGDLTRHYVADHPGRKVFWLGPERDNSIYRGLDPVLSPLEEADYIVCTGLYDDETESAEDYRGMMLKARERQLTLICANPDIVVERGDRLIYCAGAIAELYRELGGEVIFYGKPHRPWFRNRLPVRDPRHPRRGFRGRRSTRSRLGQGAVRPPAPRTDAGIEVVGNLRLGEMQRLFLTLPWRGRVGERLAQRDARRGGVERSSGARFDATPPRRYRTTLRVAGARRPSPSRGG